MISGPKYGYRLIPTPRIEITEEVSSAALSLTYTRRHMARNTAGFVFFLSSSRRIPESPSHRTLRSAFHVARKRRPELHTKFWWDYCVERGHMEDTEGEWRITLK